MSESHPAYVPCTIGYNSSSNCRVVRTGGDIWIEGHRRMGFAEEEAKRLAYHILDLLDNPYQEASPVIESAGKAASSGDAIVDETIQMLLARSRLGQAKYGTTLMRNDLSLLDWMRHAIEESLDRTLYLLRALKDLEKLYDDGH